MTVKKLALILAAVLVCGMLFACGEASSGDGDSTAEPQSTGTSKSDETTKKNDTTDKTDSTTKPAVTEPSAPAELLPESRFTLDGKLDEWKDLNTIELLGTGNTAHKHVKFYGAATEKGIYLACDSYHDNYSHGDESWWLNSNFEFFVPNGATNFQYFVYADGIGNPCKTSENVTQATMKTEALTGQATKYHTITEVFISTDDLPTHAFYKNAVNIGVAWKTADELIIGGAAHKNPDGSDDWWVPVNTWPTNCNLLVTPIGLCFPVDYYK